MKIANPAPSSRVSLATMYTHTCIVRFVPKVLFSYQGFNVALALRNLDRNVLTFSLSHCSDIV